MAVTLTTTPPLVIAAYNCVTFGLTIDDIGSGTTIKKIGYKLQDENGNDITKKESVRPDIAGAEVMLDFSEDVQGIVSTMIPKIGLPGVANDTYILKKVRLIYGEIATEDCDTIDSVNQQSDLITIVNASIQSYEKPLPLSGSRTLSHQPPVIWQYAGAYNYLWLLGTGGGNLVSDDLQSVSLVAPFPANYIPLTTQELFPNPDELSWIEYTIGSQKFKMILRHRCRRGMKFINILFLDPLGGRSAMSFEYIQEYSMQSSNEVILRHTDCNPTSSHSNDLITRQSVGMDTIFNKKNYERVTLYRDAPDNEGHLEWYKAFLGSAGYHIQSVDADGNPTWQKFIVESGTVAYNREGDSTEFIVTGFIVPSYKVHRIDR